MRIAPTSATTRTPHPMRRAGDTVVPPVSVALVQVSPPTHTTPPTSGWLRPDPAFVTQLIATAEQSPQTRALRRAEVSDVQAAYRAAAGQSAGAPSLKIRMSA